MMGRAAAIACILGLATACSGSHTTSIPKADGGAAEDTGSPAPTDSDATTMMGAGDSATAVDSAPPSGDGATSLDATTDSTTVVESGPAPPPTLADGGLEDGGGSSGTSGGNLTSLPCGSVECAIPANTCCVALNDNPPPEAMFACVGGNDCTSSSFAEGGGIGIQCSGTANCASGTICCMSDDGSGLVTAACAAPSKCTDPNLQAQLCDLKVAVPGCVADAGACSSFNIGNWGLPTGYATCGGIPH